MKIYIVIDNYSEDAKSSPYIVGVFDSEVKAKEAMASYIEQFAGTDEYMGYCDRNDLERVIE